MAECKSHIGKKKEKYSHDSLVFLLFTINAFEITFFL